MQVVASLRQRALQIRAERRRIEVEVFGALLHASYPYRVSWPGLTRPSMTVPPSSTGIMDRRVKPGDDNLDWPLVAPHIA
jgi:hypothetical protein